MARITQANLERAVGGADKLLMLADRDSTGDINSAGCQTWIQEVMDDASAEVDSYIGPTVDLNDPNLATAPILLRYEMGIAAGLAWMRGANNMAMPEVVRNEYDRVIGELQKINERKKGLGLATRPASSQLVQQVPDKECTPYFSHGSPRKRFDGWS